MPHGWRQVGQVGEGVVLGRSRRLLQRSVEFYGFIVYAVFCRQCYLMAMLFLLLQMSLFRLLRKGEQWSLYSSEQPRYRRSMMAFLRQEITGSPEEHNRAGAVQTARKLRA